MAATPIRLGNFEGFHAPAAVGAPARPPVLCVHGAFSCPVQLTPLLDHFSAAGYPTWALALRGHTPGDPVNGASVADYVMDVLAMVRQLGELPVLVGHSMGGLISLKVAETGNARAAILVAAAPPVPVMATLPALPAFLKLMPRVLLGAPIAPPVSALRRIALNQVAPELQDDILATFVEESGVAMRDIVLGRVRVDPNRIRVPLLSVFGGRDLLVPPRQMRAAANMYGATVIEYPQGGHSLFMEPWGARAMGEMTTWLDRQVAGPM